MDEGRHRALCLLLALSTAAFAALSTAQVTTRIRNKINSKWKTTGLSISVVPYQDAQATARGRYKSVTVSATDVTVSNVKMTGVKLAAADVTLDLDQLVRRNEIVTVKRKAGHLQAKVSEADLNKALAYKKNSIKNLKVHLSQGKVTFTGSYKFGLSANLKLEGRLTVVEHSQVHLVATKASVGGIPLPASALKGVLAKMNPLLDFRKLPLSPRLDKVDVQPGGITFSG